MGYKALEFLLDFGQSYAGNLGAHLHTRIVISPTYEKALLEILRESIDQYEENFGAIGSR